MRLAPPLVRFRTVQIQVFYIGGGKGGGDRHIRGELLAFDLRFQRNKLQL